MLGYNELVILLTNNNYLFFKHCKIRISNSRRKNTDEGYRRPAVRSCVLALKSILEVIGEIDVKKLNKVVLEENETRCSDLEDELGNLESLLLIEDQKEDESEDESEAGERCRGPWVKLPSETRIFTSLFDELGIEGLSVHEVFMMDENVKFDHLG
ncbi:3322_t:CDS:2 [Entrophospora sp. SA101]|nr:3322_t:CDS:2 [Entrophospora sp. SA101]